jgi:hypothetical protein
MSGCYEEQRGWICDNILSALPGADPNHVHRSFVRITDQFLQQSGAWIDDKVFHSDAFGNVRIDFSYIEAQMAWLMGVWFESHVLGHLSIVTPPFKTNKASAPLGFTNTPYPDVIVLSPGPNPGTTFEVTVRAALKMNDCSSADACVPDWLFSRYKETIRMGVIGTLMREPGKSYSSVSEGRMHQQEYKMLIGQARDEARRGFGQHEAEWGYPQQFFA